jgi:hypothetical protein
MTVLHNNGSGPVPQSRQAYGAYKAPIGPRAVRAVDLFEAGVFGSIEAAASALCVNRTYLTLVRRLDEADRFRLASGEMKLAEVYRRQRQQRAQRKRLEQSERARRSATASTVNLSDSAIERIVREVGVDRIWRAVDRLTQPVTLVAAD